MAAESTAEGMLIFDGDCGFCTASVLWLIRRFRMPVDAVPWQSLEADGRLAELGLTPAQTSRWAWWAEDGRLWRGHRAIGKGLRACRGAWPLMGALLLVPPPLCWPLIAGYRLVANLRGRLPGATPACSRKNWPPPQS